jgi:hypothetical protein
MRRSTMRASSSRLQADTPTYLLPLLQPDPDLHEADVVGEYQRALAAGRRRSHLAAFESDATSAAGGAYVHRGRDELVALYERFSANRGGISLKHCAVTGAV